MPQISAGLLMYRRRSGQVQVLLVHPGGPFWKNKDAGAWSIPKGEYGDGENALDAARREFGEELGPLPSGEISELGEIKQRGGKRVIAFALQADFDCSKFKCNSFEMEWPPRSGRRQSFPEVDQAQWFSLEDARAKINPAQAEFLDRLNAMI